MKRKQLYTIREMNVLALDLHSYNSDHFFFLDQTLNLIIDGFFTKIIYTGDDFTMNGIYIYIPLEITSFRITDQHKHIIQLIGELEANILRQYVKHTTRNKDMFSGLLNQLIHKANNRMDSNQTMILNVSGVWETETHIGLTYKWIESIKISF